MRKEEKRRTIHERLTFEPNMENLMLQYFTADDFQEIEERMIGEGIIGGKACGMLLSRKLVKDWLPGYEKHLEPHHSWFVGTSVFDDYLRENGCSEIHEFFRQNDKEEEFFACLKRMSEGTFSQVIYEQMEKVVSYYGESPFVVRSSSILEDGFDSAFSGKYESVFCINQGSMEERTEEALDAIRKVYVSAFGESAREYRKKRHLLDVDDKMAVLIQKVAGERIGDYYMPVAAGMGCSYNPYRWAEELNPEAGMIRIVMGLGTRAVERTPGDYPRLISLDHARANVHTTVEERHKFSQRRVDVISLKDREIRSVNLEEVVKVIPENWKKMTLSRDTAAENFLAQRRIYRKVYFADCQGLAENMDFIQMVYRMEQLFEKEYGRPVDIEFAVTCDDDGEWKLNLLQCRPMQDTPSEKIMIPQNADDRILFDIRRTSMRHSKEVKLDYIVWVDPQKYYEFDYYRKPDVAVLIGKINRYFEDKDKNLMLLVPGRIGTSSPELGVPVYYASVNQFCAICEVAYGKVGYNPELSYGSHMFQDLVEADIYYGAIRENSKTRIYKPELLEKCDEVLEDLVETAEELKDIVKVYETASCDASLILDARAGRAVCILRQWPEHK